MSEDTFQRPQSHDMPEKNSYSTEFMNQSATYDIVQKVSVFVHPTGQFRQKPVTGKGLIVGTAVEKKARQADPGNIKTKLKRTHD